VHEAAVLQDAQNFGLVSMPMVAISSMKSVPPLATSKRPFLEAMAEVNAPLTWPKSVDSSSSLGMAPVLMGTKACLCAAN